MPKGFLYLYAIIDVYCRYIVGWGLYSTLEASNAIEVQNRAIEEHGKPEMVNSDQVSQYTCPKRTGRTCRERAWMGGDAVATAMTRELDERTPG